MRMPRIPRILYLSTHIPIDARLDVFTEVRPLAQVRHAHRPKFEAMLACEFDQAIFIDSDTWFAAGIEDVFDTLTHFDIAMSLAPIHLAPVAESAGIYNQLEPTIPEALGEWNGGLIAARVDETFRRFVKQWSEQFSRCEALGFERDQASLRTTLVASRLRIATLPPNYNFRVNLRQTVVRSVKLFHGHGDLPRIAAAVNRLGGLRHYTPNKAWLNEPPTAGVDD